MNKNVQESRLFWLRVFIIFLLGIGLIFISALLPLLKPFIVAALVAYLSNPLIDKLVDYKVSRTLAVAIVLLALFLFFMACVLLLIPVIQKQINTLSDMIPSIVSWVEMKLIPWVNLQLGSAQISQSSDLKKIFTDNVMKAGSAGSWLLLTVFKSGKAIVELLTYTVLIPFVTFYLMRDWHIILSKGKNLIPRSHQTTVARLFYECDLAIGGFIRGQFLVMLCVAIYYSITLSMIGLQTGIAIGVIVGIVTLIPYLGLAVGITIATIAALIQFGTFSSVLLVILAFAVGHSIENFILTPFFIGNRIGLHPVVVIFAIIAGASLFGFFGLLLALPVTAIIMVLLRYFFQVYQESLLYNE